MTRKLAVLALAGALVACERNLPTTPTTPLPTSASQIFTGTLAPGDTPIVRINIPGGQLLRIYLGALNTEAGIPNGGSVTLKFGIPAADGTCTALTTVPGATAKLTAQIRVSVSQAEYCISLEDTAGLPGTTYYSVRVIFGNPSFPDLLAGTIPYSSIVAPGGATSRSFEAGADATVRVTMNQLSGAASLGVGVGYTRADGSGCDMSVFTIASTGTVLTVPVDSATYCVKVFDPGVLAAPAAFTLLIAHP